MLKLFLLLPFLPPCSKANAHVVAETVVDVNALYRTDFEDIRRTSPDLVVEMHRAVARQACVRERHGRPILIVAISKARESGHQK